MRYFVKCPSIRIFLIFFFFLIYEAGIKWFREEVQRSKVPFSLPELSVGPSVFLTFPHHCVLCYCWCSVCLFVLAILTGYSRFILSISSSNPRIRHFPRRPDSFFLRIVLGTKILKLSVLIANGMSLLLGSFS